MVSSDVGTLHPATACCCVTAVTTHTIGTTDTIRTPNTIGAPDTVTTAGPIGTPDTLRTANAFGAAGAHAGWRFMSTFAVLPLTTALPFLLAIFGPSLSRQLFLAAQLVQQIFHGVLND